ncbi:ParB N-terminal domain-containing protein [PVC group bacterium]|nr:ParB N-terminal domain-containing protein [PVC group bacterium]
MKVPLDTIIIKERVREEIGNLDSLMKSMQKHGQLNPVTLSRENELIAGHRRLLAAKEMGWQYIDVSIVDYSTDIEKLELELEENIHRKDFLPEELLAGFRRLETLRKPGLRRRIAGFFKGIYNWIFRRKKRKVKSTDAHNGSAADTESVFDKSIDGSGQMSPARSGNPYEWQDQG